MAWVQVPGENLMGVNSDCEMIVTIRGGTGQVHQKYWSEWHVGFTKIRGPGFSTCEQQDTSDGPDIAIDHEKSIFLGT